MPDIVWCDYSVCMDYAKTGAWADLAPYLGDAYPELFTCTYEQAMAKWGRNEMGILSAWWSHGFNAYSRFDFGSLQPDAVVIPILPPVGEGGKSGNLYSAPFSQVVGISYLCTEEEIAAAMKYMDFQASQDFR